MKVVLSLHYLWRVRYSRSCRSFFWEDDAHVFFAAFNPLMNQAPKGYLVTGSAGKKYNTSLGYRLRYTFGFGGSWLNHQGICSSHETTRVRVRAREARCVFRIHNNFVKNNCATFILIDSSPASPSFRASAKLEEEDDLDWGT